jgi:hypothetical protein
MKYKATIESTPEGLEITMPSAYGDGRTITCVINRNATGHFDDSEKVFLVNDILTQLTKLIISEPAVEEASR